MSTTFYPSKNTFYVKTSVAQDVIVRPSYGDLYGNTAANVDITNQPNSSLYMAQSNAPSIPKYGGGEMSECSLKYYFNTVSGNYSSTQPRFKVYKADDNITLTRGTIPNIIDSNVTNFTTYLNDDWCKETFSEVNQGFGDRSNYTKVVTAANAPINYRITGEQIYDYMSDQGYFAWNQGGWLKSDWYKRMLEDTEWTLLPQTNGDGIPNGQYRVMETIISKHGDGGNMFPESLRIASLETWIARGAVPILESGGASARTYNSYDTEFIGKVTQFNSIFNFVKEAPDVEDIKVQSVGTTGDDSKMYTMAEFVFDGKDKLTGQNAGVMRTLWENVSGTVGTDFSVNYANYFGASGTYNFPLPQSVMASIDYLPISVQLEGTSSGSSSGGSSSEFGSNCSPPATMPEIEVVFKVNKLPPMLNVSGSGGGGSGGEMTFDRGFCIAFSEKPPTSDDNFQSFLKRYNGGTRPLTGVFAARTRDAGDDDFFYLFGFADRQEVGITATNPFTTALNGAIVSSFTGPTGYVGVSGSSSFTNSEKAYMKLPIGSWITLRFKWDYRTNYMLAYTPNNFDSKGAMKHMMLVAAPPNGGTFNINSEGYINNMNSMSFWLNNMRAVNATEGRGSGGINPGLKADEIGFHNDDMKSEVLIDSINFKKYNNKIFNATITGENPTPSPMLIPPAMTAVPVGEQLLTGEVRTTISGNASVADNYYGGENTLIHTNWCWGFEEPPKTVNDFSGAGIELLLNNYSSIDDSPTLAISGNTAGSNFTGGSVSGARLLRGSYSASSGIESASGIRGLNWAIYVGGEEARPTHSVAEYIKTAGSPGFVDGFTQKGFIEVSGQYLAWTKRENPLVAARVMAANADGTDIIVDNPEIFDLPIGSAADGGTDYIMWAPNRTDKYGNNDGTFASLEAGSGSVGFVRPLHQRARRDGNIIKLNRPTNIDDNVSQATTRAADAVPISMATYFPEGYAVGSDDFRNKSRLGSLFISPKKYWLNLHFVNASGSKWGEWYRPRESDAEDKGFFSFKNTALKQRTYGPAVAVSGGIGTFGSTWNESTFSDGNYINRWSLAVDGTGVFEVDTDYGYGTYTDADEETTVNYGGYINYYAPKASSYNYVNLNKYIEVNDPTYETNFNYCLMPFTEDADKNRHYTFNINTSSAGSNKPTLIWGFNVPLASITNFTASPKLKEVTEDTLDKLLEPKSTSVELTWSEDAENVWYRLMFVDTDWIETKYHKANFIAPFNENPDTSSNYYYYSSSAEYASNTNSVALGTATPATSSDIEGFQGYGYSGTALATAANNLTLGSASEFTMLAHLKPQTTGTVMRASSSTANNDKFTLRLNSDKKLVATINASGATVTSTTTYDVDSVQPLAVAVTYNKNLDNNNLKLYVNGALEDTSDYTTDFSNTNLNLYFSKEFDSSDVYTGYLEEVSWHTKEAYILSNDNRYSLSTKNLPDLTGSKSNKYQARMFLMDYHNIRGTSTDEVARSNMASWKVTGV